MKLFIFLCLLLGIVNSRWIVGGKNAELKDAPYVVALYENGEFICGGSLIAKNKVLTAAHCVENEAYYSVRFGSKKLSELAKGYLSPVLEVIIHPNKNIDLAILIILPIGRPRQLKNIA